MTLALLFPLLFAAASAHAQTGGYYAGPVYTYTVTTTDSTGTHTVDPGQIDTSNSGIGYRASASVNATVTATFTWAASQGMTSAGPPPAQAYFLENSNASGGGNFIDGNTTAGSNGGFSADDGLGDKALKTTTPHTGGVAYDCISKGFHLITKSGGTIQFSHSLSSTLSSQPNNFSCSIFYSVATTNRGITAGFVSYRKSPVMDSSGNQTKDANGDLNYTTHINDFEHGDTIYSYYTYVKVTNPDTGKSVINSLPSLNTLNVIAQYFGTWHHKTWTDPRTGADKDVPDVVNPDTWSWSPSNSNDYWDTGIFQMPYAPNFNYGIDGNPNGVDTFTKETLTYSATDNQDSNHIPANTICLVTIHDPYEKKYADHKSDNFVNPRRVSTNLVSSGPNDTLGGGITVQVQFAVAASAANPTSTWVGSVLGLNIAAQASANISVQNTASTKGLPRGWYTYVVLYDHYYDHIGKADTWGASGYTGTAPYAIREVPSELMDQFGLKMADPVQGNLP